MSIISFIGKYFYMIVAFFITVLIHLGSKLLICKYLYHNLVLILENIFLNFMETKSGKHCCSQM